MYFPGTFYFILGIACSKEYLFEKFYAWSLLNNTESWEGTSYFRKGSNDLIDVSFEVYNDKGYRRQHLYIRNVKKRKDTVFLNPIDFSKPNSYEPESVFFAFGSDGNALYGHHELLKGTSWILLEDIRKRQITGKFNLSFGKDPDKNFTPYADTLHFKEGTFFARYLD